MKNPNSYIRTAYIEAISLATGLDVWAKEIPADKKRPKQYILISSQSKEYYAEDKESYEWMCSLVVDIYSIREKGYPKPQVLDDIEEQVLNVINDDLDAEPFVVKSTRLADNRDLDTENKAETINRRILTFTHWLSNED